MLRFVAAALVAAFLCPAAGASPARDPSLALASRSDLRSSSPLVASLTAFGAGPAARADTLSIARRYLGGNPTGHRSLWCARFVGHVERKAGRKGTGSALARSYLGYGRKVSLASARPGDIVVLSRGRRGGHVGFLVSRSGSRVTLISGNACSPRRVCQSSYPVSRVIGVRRP